MEEILKTYKQLQESDAAKKNIVKNTIYRLGSLKLFIVIGVLVCLFLFTSQTWLLWIIVPLAVILFLYLNKYQSVKIEERDFLEKRMEVCGQEVQALEKNDISSFDGGVEYMDSSHFYTYDLDVFGSKSLFQLINRTATQLGKVRLAGWMNFHSKDKKEIEERQDAVKELSGLFSFRILFRTLGLLYKGRVADEKEIQKWALSKPLFIDKPLLKFIPYLSIVINVVLFTLAVCGMLSFTLWGMLFTFFIFLSIGFSRRINKEQESYSKNLQILSTYAVLIQEIEKQPMKAPLLKQLKDRLKGEDTVFASASVQRLSKLMNALDQRNNIIVFMLFNGFMFWELWQMMRIEQWRKANARYLEQWLDVVGQIEALCSLATFAYNNPDYIYPTVTDGDFKMQASALGHPLMVRGKCVCNDFSMGKISDFVVVTGANMAGKSTYLRVVGANFLLACIGAPVYAKEMSITPVQLITSLRTTDSLTENESYFFAELKRLKMIIDKLAMGEKLFIILDEILKGTNSVDKQKGSLALVKQLISLKANGIIATHDLLLGSLAEAFPEDVHNYCFEADIINDELSFSYHLRSGIAQNMNAYFLMKKMGIVME